MNPLPLELTRFMTRLLEEKFTSVQPLCRMLNRLVPLARHPMVPVTLHSGVPLDVPRKEWHCSIKVVQFSLRSRPVTDVFLPSLVAAPLLPLGIMTVHPVPVAPVGKQHSRITFREGPLVTLLGAHIRYATRMFSPQPLTIRPTFLVVLLVVVQSIQFLTGALLHRASFLTYLP